MPEKLNIALNMQIVGGPNISISMARDIEAYDKLEVTITAGASDVEVEVQPSAEGQVGFFMIGLKDDKHYGTEVSYKVNNTGGDSVTLDAPHVLIGHGAVGLMKLQAPLKLYFSNTHPEDIAVQALVGRDATP